MRISANGFESVDVARVDTGEVSCATPTEPWRSAAIVRCAADHVLALVDCATLRTAACARGSRCALSQRSSRARRILRTLHRRCSAPHLLSHAHDAVSHTSYQLNARAAHSTIPHRSLKRCHHCAARLHGSPYITRTIITPPLSPAHHNITQPPTPHTHNPTLANSTHLITPHTPHTHTLNYQHTSLQTPQPTQNSLTTPSPPLSTPTPCIILCAQQLVRSHQLKADKAEGFA